MARRSERPFLNASNEWITNWTDMSSLRATALLSPTSRPSSAIDFGGRFADIHIAPSMAHLTRWHEAVSKRTSAKA